MPYGGLAMDPESGSLFFKVVVSSSRALFLARGYAGRNVQADISKTTMGRQEQSIWRDGKSLHVVSTEMICSWPRVNYPRCYWQEYRD